MDNLENLYIHSMIRPVVADAYINEKETPKVIFQDEVPNASVLEHIDFDPEPATEYTVTIGTITNGTVAANPVKGTKDTEITLTATPAEGYQFKAWDVKDASENPITVTDNKFSMPDSDVTVGATFEVIPATKYTLTLVVDPEGAGTVTGAGEYNANEQVEISATPGDTYEFVKWSDEDTNATRTITIDGNVELTAIFQLVEAPGTEE